MQRLYPAIAEKFLISNGVKDVPDGAEGLYFRLCNTVLQAKDLASLIERTQTKRYTRSRIRRVILNTLLGVTSSDLSVYPRYTQLLGASPLGLSLLKRIKHQTDFPILTKPSDTDKLPDGAKRQKALSDAADRLYYLTLPQPIEPYRALTYTPYIQK
jgi:predicted nucleotidyltransferase